VPDEQGEHKLEAVVHRDFEFGAAFSFWKRGENTWCFFSSRAIDD
jgi:hypothetical protein